MLKGNKVVMLFGIGSIGGWVLEFLARSEGIDTIVAADAREDYGRSKVDGAAVGAAHMGYSKRIEFRGCDVFDIDRTAELLKGVDPEVIYNGMALPMTLAAALTLPSEIGKAMTRWATSMFPIHLVPCAKLMQAVKRAGIAAHVVNNAAPDLTNPVLWRRGLGPLVGAGNIDNRLGEIRRLVCLEENVLPNRVGIQMICDHALMAQGAIVPHFLKISIDGKDVTKDIVRKFGEAKLLARHLTYNAAERDAIGLPHMASSAVRNIKAIVNDTNELAHSPGPNGLPGGYPIRIGAKGVEVVLPEGISMEQAIKINTDGMKFEGVEEIKADGTVVFVDEARAFLKDVFGLDVSEVPFEDAEQLAKDLLESHKKLVERYGSSSTTVMG